MSFFELNACNNAAMKGHLNCLKWAIQNGCLWDINECLKIAIQFNHSHVEEWINDIFQ